MNYEILQRKENILTSVQKLSMQILHFENIKRKMSIYITYQQKQRFKIKNLDVFLEEEQIAHFKVRVYVAVT